MQRACSRETKCPQAVLPAGFNRVLAEQGGASRSANCYQFSTAGRTRQVLSLVDAGLAVIPVRARSKQPLVRWAVFQAQAPDRGLVLDWAQRWPGCGWAVITGAPSGGLVVIDFDKAGDYQRWAAAWPDIAQAAPTVKTARGVHVYLAGPAGQRSAPMRNFSGDVKAAGGYVLVPPSVHPSGAIYTWLRGDPTRFIPHIDNLHDVGVDAAPSAPVITRKRAALPLDRQPTRLKPCAAAILSSVTPVGARNVTAFRLALHLRAEGWSEAATLYLLGDWWARSTLPGEGVQRQAELARTVVSAYQPGRTGGHGCRAPEIAPFCDERCRLAAWGGRA